MEAAYVVACICNREWSGDVPEMWRGAVDVHAMAELAQQDQDAWTVQRQRPGVVSEQVEAVMRVGKQEGAQGFITRLGVETKVVEVLLEDA